MRTFILATTAAATLFASVAFTQESRQGTASIPDFSGIWAHASDAHGFEPPLSGPRPVTNRSRLANGRSNPDQLVGDYNNPILQPWAAELVKKYGEIELSGGLLGTRETVLAITPTVYFFESRHADVSAAEQYHDPLRME